MYILVKTLPNHRETTTKKACFMNTICLSKLTAYTINIFKFSMFKYFLSELITDDYCFAIHDIYKNLSKKLYPGLN